MALIVDALSWALLIAGVVLGITGAIGTIRFPDFYTRVHASSVTDTLCALCIIAGLILQAGFTLVTVKLVFILLFLWYTSPVATHALVRAAHHMGLPPYLSNNASADAQKGKS
ncbi:MAG: Sodium:proton antiporter [uncultured Thiotrichaceae bacterium]|uniref:Sodium:proton antiporter n=1 Tax=uncultured Thiotrichaceae bacterium TaxID=298394 RepID=A0A6S6SRU4_9GAMM|nr:MAG: Sodium:proton antiporter [uncultured Thiotrichaceae bacterium]